MTGCIRCRLGILLLSAIRVWAQGSPGFMVLGNPYPKVTVSPGQVTTLSLTGAPTILPTDSNGGDVPVRAATVPLPTTLAGFSASLYRAPAGPPLGVSLPMLSVLQTNFCNPPQQTPVCVLTLLTVQIPGDVILPNYPVGPGHPTFLTISDHGSPILNLYVSVEPVAVHILTSCESQVIGFSFNSLSCNPLITRADGSLVGPLSGSPTPAPVQPGEILVIYATGLGVTQPAVPVGTASPTPPAVALRHFSIVLNYDCGKIVTVTPDFVGLTPGEVGLYQVNFRVPQPVACTAFSQPGFSSGGSLTLLSDDWISSDTVLLYLGANTSAAVN